MSSDGRLAKARLAFAFVAGPLFALAMQSLAYAEVPWACTRGRSALVHLVPAIFVALTLLAVLSAYSAWSRAGRHGQADADTVDDRTRFLGLGGLILSMASLVLIVAMWIPLFVFDPCVR
jgi:hypothetical protein